MQLGPYPLEKMRALAKQGQVGRSYQISNDGGVTWDSGGGFPEIFSPGEDDRTNKNTPGGRLGGKSQTGTAAGETQWHYCPVFGDETGPIAESALRELIEIGALGPTDTVWTEALGDKWVAASAVPKFAPLFGATSSSSTRNATDQTPQQAGTVMTNGGGSEGGVFCRECGSRMNRRAVICTQCGVPAEQDTDSTSYVKDPASRRSGSHKERKSRHTAAILAFLLGGLGAHHFYLGNIGLGVIYLIFCLTLIPAFIAFIECIVFLCMSDQAFDEKYNS